MGSIGRFVSLSVLLLWQTMAVKSDGNKMVDSGVRKEMDFSKVAERILHNFDHRRAIAERWAPNLMAGLSLYAIDAQYNKNCLGHLMELGNSVKAFKMWSLKMVDAIGKPGSYILRGNTQWAGSYDTCMDSQGDNPFHPAYCWVDVKIEKLDISLPVPGMPAGFPIRTAICMPDSCPSEELFKIFQKVPDILNLPFYTEHINITGVQCVTTAPSMFEDTWTVIAMSIILAIVLLMALGTAMEYYLDYKEKCYTGSDEPSDAGFFWEMFLAFSVPRNWKKITDFTPNDYGLSPIHGLRAIFVIWAIAANTYFMGIIVTDNVLDFLEASKGNYIQVLLKFSLGMDGLFFLSALGVTFYFLTAFNNKTSQIKMLPEYLFRILRMWVPYMVILLLFFCAIGRYMGEGPFWSIAEKNVDKCQKDWWWSASYINNFFIKTEEQCMRHSWYMALDMQYYILMPLILVPLARWAPMGFIIAAIMQIVCMAISGLITYKNKMPLMIDLAIDRPGHGKYDDYMDYLYVKPYYHIGGTILGIVCGWTLFKIQCQAEMRKIWVILGWILCAGCIFYSVFGNTYEQTDLTFSVLYHMFKEVAFVLGLFWIVLACATGHGGFIDGFLNFPFWYPLGRVSYCAFLVHVGWILVAFINTEMPRHFGFSLQNCYAISNIVISYTLGFLLSLAAEAPLLNIKRYLMQSPQYKRIV